MNKIAKFLGIVLLVTVLLVVSYFSYFFIRGFLWHYGIVKLPPSLVDPQISVSNDNHYLVFSTTSPYYPPYVWLSTSRDGVRWSSPSFIYQCGSPQLSLNDKGRPLIACSSIVYPHHAVVLSLKEDSNWSRVEIMNLDDFVYPSTTSLVKDEKSVFWLALEDYNSSFIYSSQNGVDWVEESVILPPEESIFGWSPRFVVNGSDLLLVLQGYSYSWVYLKTESGWTKQVRFNSTVNSYPTQHVKDANDLYWTTYSEDDVIYVKYTTDFTKWSDAIQVTNEQVLGELLAKVSNER